jgi:hypothetical protein
MLRSARIRYRLARSAGHSILQSLGFALFKLRPSVQRQIDCQNRALLTELKRKRDDGAECDRDYSPPT